MSDIPLTEADLQAYVDGRMPESRRAEVEQFLASRPGEAERLEAYRTQKELLRSNFRGVLDEPVPDRLLAVTRPRPPRVWRVAAALGWIVFGTVLGWFVAVEKASAPIARQAEAPLAHSAAIAHATYSPEVRHPVEVGADQEEHLVAWLSKRLGTPIRAPHLEAAGYSLVGGRLLPGDASSPRAQFMYQCKRGTRVTLYVRTGAEDHGETAFRYADEDGGVRVFYWIDRRFGYALSSADISREDLLKVANAAYRQLNP